MALCHGKCRGASSEAEFSRPRLCPLGPLPMPRKGHGYAGNGQGGRVGKLAQG